MIVAVSVYDVVLAVHIMAVVAAFGGLFAYPLLVGVARRADPRALGSLHRAQQRIIGRLILPGLIVVVAAGIYLAADHKQFSEFYV
ncbi:MAG: hypothetical protein LC720_07210, partial [Actinobacteria bacterium]|nr:hypothetical protein [Actinomycetota bacterium]